MGRRKIRHFAYNLAPDEILPIFRSAASNKPRLGRGSGRAGGARSATHEKDHKHLVHPGTNSENCPICRFGRMTWFLWVNSHSGISDEWAAHWEGREEELKEFQRFVGRYEAFSYIQTL